MRSECAIVRNDPHWIDEGVDVPRRAACRPASVGAGDGRSYGSGWPATDVTESRHRYVVDRAIADPMRAAGWVLEGPVFCAPS